MVVVWWGFGGVLGLFSLCWRGFWVVLGWIWCGGGARVKLFESPPLMRNDGDRLPSNCRFRWCFGALLVGVGGPGFGLLCAAGSGKFEKLLRSDLGPFGGFGWCRVCLLFENSIVCQVC